MQKKRKSKKKKKEKCIVDYCCIPQCIWVWGNSNFPTPFSYMYNTHTQERIMRMG